MAATSGKYAHRITLESPPDDPTPDAGGDVPTPFLPRLVVWANVETLAGRELVNAQQVKETVDTRITLRWLAGIDDRWRCQFRGHIYNFNSVLDLPNRRVELTILATSDLAERDKGASNGQA